MARKEVMNILKVDLSNLEEIGSYKEIKREINIPEFSYRNQEIDTPYSFQLDINIYNTASSFVFTGDLNGNLLLTCNRCLEKFKEKVEIKVEQEIMKEDIKDIGNVDLTDMIIENIVLAIPMKIVCREGCKGLCPLCGQNLNEEECDCEEEKVDPRLAKLKNFYQDNEN